MDSTGRLSGAAQGPFYRGAQVAFKLLANLRVTYIHTPNCQGPAYALRAPLVLEHGLPRTHGRRGEASLPGAAAAPSTHLRTTAPTRRPAEEPPPPAAPHQPRLSLASGRGRRRAEERCRGRDRDRDRGPAARLSRSGGPRPAIPRGPAEPGPAAAAAGADRASRRGGAGGGKRGPMRGSAARLPPRSPAPPARP